MRGCVPATTCAVLVALTMLAPGVGQVAEDRHRGAIGLAAETLEHPGETVTARMARHDEGPNAPRTSRLGGQRDAAALVPPAEKLDRRAGYTYDVAVRGEVATDPDAFAERAAAILTDKRGWALDGELGFSPVPESGDLTLVLASPAAVDAAHPVCGPRYSCRVEDEVLINDRAWREATPAFRKAGGDLPTYRRYVLQHEIGHWLGYDHRDCPGTGEPAPVMHQQSMSLSGCTPRGWSLAHERAAARDDHLR